MATDPKELEEQLKTAMELQRKEAAFEEEREERWQLHKAKGRIARRKKEEGHNKKGSRIRESSEGRTTFEESFIFRRSPSPSPSSTHSASPSKTPSWASNTQTHIHTDTHTHTHTQTHCDFIYIDIYIENATF